MFLIFTAFEVSGALTEGRKTAHLDPVKLQLVGDLNELLHLLHLTHQLVGFLDELKTFLN